MPNRSAGTESKQAQGAKRGAPRHDGKAQRGGSAHHESASVQDFLDRYAAAFTAGDVKAVAQLWEAPAFVIDAQAAIPVTHTDEVEKFFAGAKDQYNSHGITSTKAEMVDLDWISDDLVIVKVRWPYQNDAGETLGAESSTYILKRGKDGEFKIRVVTMRGVEQSGERTETPPHH